VPARDAPTPAPAAQALQAPSAPASFTPTAVQPTPLLPFAEAVAQPTDMIATTAQTTVARTATAIVDIRALVSVHAFRSAMQQV
jgi:hypothetical protein